MSLLGFETRSLAAACPRASSPISPTIYSALPVLRFVTRDWELRARWPGNNAGNHRRRKDSFLRGLRAFAMLPPHPLSFLCEEHSRESLRVLRLHPVNQPPQQSRRGIYPYSLIEVEISPYRPSRQCGS